MFKKKSNACSFYDVALFLIIVGIIIFTYGLVGWVFNTLGNSCHFVQPSTKIIGGMIILGLGYIHLELELLRTKN